MTGTSVESVYAVEMQELACIIVIGRQLLLGYIRIWLTITRTMALMLVEA